MIYLGTIIVIAATVILCVNLYCVKRIVHAKRIIEQVKTETETRLAETSKREEHVIFLDMLLMEICLKAYQNTHVPIWKAWAQTMGHFQTTWTTKAERLEIDKLGEPTNDL